MNLNTGLETENESPEKRKLFNVERIKEGEKIVPATLFFLRANICVTSRNLAHQPESFRKKFSSVIIY